MVSLLTGWAIPTITNFLIAYFLLLFFPEKLSKLFKLFIFILLSFILGVNIKIPYIFTIFHSYDIPEINSIKIIHPLSSSTEPVYFRSGKLEFKVDGHIKLKTSFFGSVEIGGDEGCMCMYFTEPYTPFTGNPVRDGGLVFDKLGAIGANSINYRFDQIIPNNNGIVVYTTIKDVKGGHIIIQSTFPKGLGYTDTSFDHGGGDRSHFKKYFWRYIFFILINDNIWQNCLSRLEKTKVSDPLESLLKLKKETYISPISIPPPTLPSGGIPSAALEHNNAHVQCPGGSAPGHGGYNAYLSNKPLCYCPASKSVWNTSNNTCINISQCKNYYPIISVQYPIDNNPNMNTYNGMNNMTIYFSCVPSCPDGAKCYPSSNR